MNIIDYLDWRGDLTFSNSPFCQVDSLIFSRLAYFDFTSLFNIYDEKITIKEAYERFSKIDSSKKKILIEGDNLLFPALAESERYGNCILTRFVNKVSNVLRKQFSAITIILPDDTIFVSFRGTDNTIVGWREDMDMSFLDNVPCQLDGLDYLEEIASKFTTQKLRIGGHSKGGNIAIYASSFCSYLTKERIIEVFNNDGPGLSDSCSKKEEYLQMLDRIHTFIPQSSVIGRLLTHKEKYTVVLSKEKGIMQHDVYSWQVLGQNFITLDEVDDGSIFVDETVREFLQKSSPEQRSKTLDIIFGLLEKTNATTMKEISKNKFENYSLMLKEYNDLDKETKEVVLKTANLLFVTARSVLIDKYSEKLEEEKNKLPLGEVKEQIKTIFQKK
jgi:hypothetical protein